MKKTILHFAYHLGRGGAETMLVRVLKDLKEYNNIVVIMGADDHFGEELKADVFIKMNLTNIASFVWAIPRLRSIIRKYKPDLVHTHLFWPTIIARMAVPRKIPLLTTIHAFIASSLEYTRWHIRVLDKISYRMRPSVIIAVAKGALDEYFSFLHLKPFKSYVLYTFVDTAQFIPGVQGNEPAAEDFKIISVGALRAQKNYAYLVTAMSMMNDPSVTVDIYGMGPLRPALEEQIRKTGASIALKGEVKNIQERFGQYQLFCMPSIYEGFSLAVLEAMAMKKPLLLSDIASFREQCEDTAVYFSLDDPQDFTRKLEMLKGDEQKRKELAEKAYKRVTDNFTLEQHLQKLRNIYSEVLLQH